MKVIYPLMLAVSLLLSRQVSAQHNFNDSIADSRNQIVRSSMVILGSWAVANIISGFSIGGATSGEANYFWKMNAYWNFINLGLAGMGYLNALKAAVREYTFADNAEAQAAIEKIYLFNFGLDLAYIAGGFYLGERANANVTLKSRQQFKGYGASISAQGGFLLIMDGVLFLLHHQNTVRVNKILRKIELNAGPGGLGVRYLF
jgi:hypothetical protein